MNGWLVGRWMDDGCMVDGWMDRRIVGWWMDDG